MHGLNCSPYSCHHASHSLCPLSQPSRASACHKTFYPLCGQSQQMTWSICESLCQSGSTADKISWNISEMPPGIFWDRHEQKFSSSLILSTIPALNSPTEQYHTSIHRGTKTTSAYLHLHGISQDLKGLGGTQGMLKTYSLHVNGLVPGRVSESIRDAGWLIPIFH